MVELRVNSKRVDLKADVIIALTYAVNDIGSIETRQGVSSNQFDVPITDNNLDIFGYPTLFNIFQNVNPFKKIPAEIYEDELRISKGYIQIDNPSLQNDTIPVNFFGENADWFNLIKGKSIRELPLTDCNHVFQPSTIQSSFSNTDGYKYALIDRNGLNFLSGNELSSQCFTLNVFQSTIVKDIVEQAGYKIKGTLLLDNLYKKTLITDTNDRFYSLDQERDRSSSLGVSTPLTISPTADTRIVFDESGGLATKGDNYLNGVYTADTSYYASISTTLRFQNNGAGSTDYVAKIKINGSDVSTDIGTLPSGNTTFVQLNAGDLFINNSAYRFLEEGDTVEVTVSTTSEDLDIFATEIVDVGGVVGTLVLGSFAVFVNSIAIEGSNIKCSAVLPDIDQADFIKDVVFDHNALITVNLSTKEISFDLKKYSYSNFADWSRIIDLSQDVEINYTEVVSNYNQINDVKRAETDGVFIKEYDSQNRIKYGDSQILLDNEFLDNRGTLFESKFGATYQINSLNTNQALPYIIGDQVSDTFQVLAFDSTGILNEIQIPLDSKLDDFLEVPANSVWALVTESDNATYNRAYSIVSITNDGTNYIISVNFEFTANATGVVRLITRGEEATPRKLIDGGNFVIEENNDKFSSYDITSTLPATEDSVNITSMPYLYFWNTLIGKPTDVLNISLSYGKINIPSLCSTLLEDYYPNTIDILQNGKMLKASFRLTQVDIFNLDFNKLIYLNFTIKGQTINGYFILNKIEEYSGSDDSTVVELIKY